MWSAPALPRASKVPDDEHRARIPPAAGLAEGLTDQQIARRLGIAPSTVNHYMKGLRTKLGEHAGNRWQLARMAFVLGLADPPPRRRMRSGRADR
jgi:hypothetical protein